MARTQPEYLCLRATHAGESHHLNLASAPLQHSDSWGSSPEEILLASPLFAEAAKEQQSICSYAVLLLHPVKFITGTEGSVQ